MSDLDICREECEETHKLDTAGLLGCLAACTERHIPAAYITNPYDLRNYQYIAFNVGRTLEDAVDGYVVEMCDVGLLEMLFEPGHNSFTLTLTPNDATLFMDSMFKALEQLWSNEDAAGIPHDRAADTATT